MANHKIIAVRACPETKPTVHKNIWFSWHEFHVHECGRVTSCNVDSERIHDFNGFELLKV
jgi:hypothetical protein